MTSCIDIPNDAVLVTTNGGITTTHAINYVTATAVTPGLINLTGTVAANVTNGSIAIKLYSITGGGLYEAVSYSGQDLIIFQSPTLDDKKIAGSGPSMGGIYYWRSIVGLDSIIGILPSTPGGVFPGQSSPAGFWVTNGSGSAMNTVDDLYDTSAIFGMVINDDDGNYGTYGDMTYGEIYFPSLNFMDVDLMQNLATVMEALTMTRAGITLDNFTFGIDETSTAGAMLASLGAIVSITSPYLEQFTLSADNFNITTSVAGATITKGAISDGKDQDGKNDRFSFEVEHFSSYNVKFTATVDDGNDGNSSGGGGSSGTLYYNVMFHTDGGSLINTERVASGQTAYKPVDPSKAGFAFAGWYADKELTTPFDFTKAISSNTWVYAKWTPSTAPQLVLKFNIGQITSYFKSGNAAEVAKPLDAAPFLKGNRTFLPIRYVVEPLGGTITWNQEEQKVTITKGTSTIELWIGNNMAKINGKQVQIDAANPDVKPMIVNPGRTMLPLRFISEALGCTVEWDQLTYQVTVKN